MGKIAFLFAGQGAQAPGMGSFLIKKSEAAEKIFESAEKIRPGTMEQCFAGTAEELRKTTNTQPCLFTVEIAAAKALKEAGIKADAAAGFSLGEFSAICYGGIIDFEKGLKLVMKRSELMQASVEMQRTSMAAIVRLTEQQVYDICAKFQNVYPVNLNCPGQISVSGDEKEIAEIAAIVKEAGGKAIPIKVNGAFHSPYMDDAAEQFADIIKKTEFADMAISVYSNFTGERYGDIKTDLSQQMNHPVLWEKTIRKMIEEGMDTFIEIGPGKTLSGFMKKIDPEVKSYSVSNEAELDTVIKEVRKC